jgi:crotonobetainyl-CoA:carnitine CoA-transferase CaiB-like acyl-CoA transferase
VDELSLKRINPNIILAHFDAFGGPHHGPRSDAVGYDDLVQAATGIMVRFGGSLKTPAEHAHLGTVDVVSGFSGCLSTCLSLFKRLRTGVCDVARTSLASNAQFIQIPFMSDWVGKNPSIVANEPSGPYAVGEHWLYRWYKTKYIGLKNNVEESMGIEAAGGNGHIFIALGSLNGSIFQNAIAVLSRLGCKDMYKEGMTDNDRSNKLQKWILNLRLNADEVSYLLNKNGITNIPLNSMTNLRESNTSTCKSFSLNQNNSGGLTHHFHKIKNHPIGGSVEMYSPCSLLSSNVEINIMKPQPKYGEHTKLILKNVLHFNDNEINTFIKNGDVGLQWSNHYIPDGGTNLNPWNNVKMEYKVMMDRVKQLRIVDSKL